MNTKILTVATSLILSLGAVTAHAADAARVDHIVDLPAVTVRPDAPYVAHVVDLPAVTVRPDAALRAELASQAFVARIVEMPAIYVRPTAEQLAERAAIVATEQARVLTAQLADNLLAQTLAATLP